MNKKEIIFWKNRYDKEEDLYNKGLEEELREKFRKNNQITKSDLIKIIKWKFQGRLLGRQKRILNLLKDVEDSSIKEISKVALNSNKDEEKLRLLSSIKGMGSALSSVILTFYDPQNYGILDIHAWRGLFGEKEPSDVFSNSKNAIKFFDKLRKISFKTGLPCRDIEKAFFKKDLEKSKRISRTKKKPIKRAKKRKSKHMLSKKEEELSNLLASISRTCNNCGSLRITVSLSGVFLRDAKKIDRGMECLVKICRKCGHVEFFNIDILEKLLKDMRKHPAKYLCLRGEGVLKGLSSPFKGLLNGLLNIFRLK